MRDCESLRRALALTLSDKLSLNETLGFAAAFFGMRAAALTLNLYGFLARPACIVAAEKEPKR